MTKQQALDNLKLFLLVRVFSMRVFLPLSAIYFTSVSGLSLKELGILGAYFSVVSILLESPSGYFADRFGKSKSLQFAGVMNIIATLFYVVFQNKTGVFVGVFFEAVGYSFISGAKEAILHDTLEVLGRNKEYTKVASKLQSKALLINVFVISLIPMTYAIDERVPFIIGTIAYAALTVVGYKIRDVKNSEKSFSARKSINFKLLKRNRRFLTFSLVFGLIGALYTAPSDFQNVALKNFGFNPVYLGWLFAASSLLGALIGNFAYILKAIGLKKYAVLDSAVLTVSFAGYFTGNLYIASLFFVISLGFWRFRKIIYQDHLLEKYPTRYKATMLSVVSNIEQIHAAWVTVFIAWLVSFYGITKGFGILAVFASIISIISIPLIVSFLRKTSDK